MVLKGVKRDMVQLVGSLSSILEVLILSCLLYEYFSTGIMVLKVLKGDMVQ